MALIPLFKIWNIVSYKSVDKEKIKLIMICVHAQMFTNNHRLLWNSHPGDNPGAFHFRYIISFVYSKTLSNHSKKN